MVTRSEAMSDWSMRVSGRTTPSKRERKDDEAPQFPEGKYGAKLQRSNSPSALAVCWYILAPQKLF
jgi:hypothetical protein